MKFNILTSKSHSAQMSEIRSLNQLKNYDKMRTIASEVSMMQDNLKSLVSSAIAKHATITLVTSRPDGFFNVYRFDDAISVAFRRLHNAIENGRPYTLGDFISLVQWTHDSYLAHNALRNIMPRTPEELENRANDTLKREQTRFVEISRIPNSRLEWYISSRLVEIRYLEKDFNALLTPQFALQVSSIEQTAVVASNGFGRFMHQTLEYARQGMEYDGTNVVDESEAFANFTSLMLESHCL